MPSHPTSSESLTTHTVKKNTEASQGVVRDVSAEKTKYMLVCSEQNAG